MTAAHGLPRTYRVRPAGKLSPRLRKAGLADAAADALATLSDHVDVGEAEQFCTAHGLSKESLVNRLGGSP